MLAKQTIFALLSVASAALALPATRDTPFKLVANVTAFDLTPSIQGFELVPATNNEGNVLATLAPSGGAEWATSGDTVVLASGAGAIGVLPGGTATVPATRPVTVNPGAGTDGVTVSTTEAGAEGTAVVQFRHGTWMACPLGILQNGSGLAEGTVVLSYKLPGQRTLFGCANVNLLVQ